MLNTPPRSDTMIILEKLVTKEPAIGLPSQSSAWSASVRALQDELLHISHCLRPLGTESGVEIKAALYSWWPRTGNDCKSNVLGFNN